MTDELKDLLEAFSDASLSDDERSALRERLQAFMIQHPVRVPFRLRMADAAERLMTAFYSPRLQTIAASFALVAVAGTGTAYAAGNSLPGQPLYALKVNIEEPLQGAFATSAEAQANWNAQLATRRLGEAAQLAASDQLTPAAQTAVTGGLDQATENFDANIAQLSTTSEGIATAADLESNMEATLAANTQVLIEIQTAVPSAATSIQPLLSRVRTRAVAVNSARAQLDIAAASANVASVKAEAESQLDAAEGQLSNVSQTVTAASGSASSSDGVVKQAIAAGQANLKAGDYGAALRTFQTATLVAQEAQITTSVTDQVEATAGVELPATTTPILVASASVTATSSASVATSTQTTNGDATSSGSADH